MVMRCPSARMGELNCHFERSQILSSRKRIMAIAPTQAVQVLSNLQTIAENPQIVGEFPNSLLSFDVRMWIYLGIQ